jgi:hypothetical protein
MVLDEFPVRVRKTRLPSGTLEPGYEFRHRSDAEFWGNSSSSVLHMPGLPFVEEGHRFHPFSLYQWFHGPGARSRQRSTLRY